MQDTSDIVVILFLNRSIRKLQSSGEIRDHSTIGVGKLYRFVLQKIQPFDYGWVGGCEFSKQSEATIIKFRIFADCKEQSE